MMNFKKSRLSFIPFCLILISVLLILILSFPDASFASLADDMIAREGWKKISLDFEGANLINILKIFSQQSGLNFVAAQDVAGKVITLYLENVPLREALEKILNSHNLTYELDEGSNIFIVKELIKPPVETITKIYALKYARVNSSPLNTASDTSISGNSLQDVLSGRLSSYGKISEDIRTNSLIITDVPYAFEVIDDTIKKLDVPIPQVLIEVEIIDTTKSLVDHLGFTWSQTGLLSYILPSYSGKLGMLGVEEFIKSDHVEHGTFRIGPSTTSSAMNLKHLMTSSDTKILARPKILTLSNEKATIKITGDDAIGTIVSKDDEGNVESITAERAPIGVEMVVTPSVNVETGEITMVLEPKVTSAETSALVDDNGNFFKNPQERSAKVTLIVKNNQTIILGGLLRQDLDETKTKVPFLGDIPFLGALFRSRDKETDKNREMLVFITPHIVDSTGVSLAQIENSYNTEILTQREQSGDHARKEEIDKVLSIWDN